MLLNYGVAKGTLESPLDSEEIQSILKENSPGRTHTEAETLIFWLPDAKSRLIWKDPDAGKIEGQRRRGQKIRCLDGIIDLMDMGLSKLQKLVMDGEAWHAAVHWVAKPQHHWATELNWTDP